MENKQQTKTIFKRLIDAQKHFKSAVRDSSNPFFKSKYADLASVWDACKDALAEQDLFVSQQVEAGGLVTKIYDETGATISSTLPIIVARQNDPQAYGSAITYARRYSLASILGIITDDDDGNRAAGHTALKDTKQEIDKAQAFIDHISRSTNINELKGYKAKAVQYGKEAELSNRIQALMEIAEAKQEVAGE